MVIDRVTNIYIKGAIGKVYPYPTLYPSPDLFPNKKDIIINDNSYEGIVGGTLQLDEIICDGELKFGQTISNKFECSLFNMQEVDIVGKRIEVWQRVNGAKVPIFVGTIESSKLDNSGIYRDIIAYDEFYSIKDKNVADWWKNLWAQTDELNLKQFRESFISYLGLECVTDKSFINDSVKIHKYDDLSSILAGDIFRMIGEIQLFFPNINRSGQLELISLSKTVDADLDGEVKLYEGNNSTWEEFSTATITGVGIYSTADELSQLTGTNENVYKISENILLFDKNASQMDTIMTRILNELKDIEYVPCQIKMIASELGFALGQKIKTEKGESFIMENHLSGSLFIEQELKSSGNRFLDENPTSYSKTIIDDKKWSMIRQDIDGITLEVGGKCDKTDVVNQINLSSEAITLKGNRLIIDATNISLDKDGHLTVNGATFKNGGINCGGKFTVDSTGKIKAVSGEIGGFTIANDRLSGSIIAGSKVLGSQLACGDYAINAQGNISFNGDGTFFIVYDDGTTYANNINLYQGAVIGRTDQGAFMQFDTDSGSFSIMGVDRDNNSLFFQAWSDSWSGSGGADMLGISTKVGFFDRVHFHGDYTFLGESWSVHSFSCVCYTDISLYGNVYNASTSIIAVSDKNLKNSIEKLDKDASAEFIYSLNPSKFKMNNGTSDRYHHGFIAQEVKESMGKDDWGVYCDFEVKEDENGESKEVCGLRYEELIADLVATVQKQHEEIESLKADIKALKKEVN